jgi:hypothetical protein
MGGRGARLRLPAAFRRDERLVQQRGQPLPSVFPVLRLRPEPSGVDDDHAVRRHPAPGNRTQPPPDVVVQRIRARSVEPQLNGRRDLVDVLTARARSPYETLLELGFVDVDAIGYVQHAVSQCSNVTRRPGLEGSGFGLTATFVMYRRQGDQEISF